MRTELNVMDPEISARGSAAEAPPTPDPLQETLVQLHGQLADVCLLSIVEKARTGLENVGDWKEAASHYRAAGNNEMVELMATRALRNAGDQEYRVDADYCRNVAVTAYEVTGNFRAIGDMADTCMGKQNTPSWDDLLSQDPDIQTWPRALATKAFRRHRVDNSVPRLLEAASLYTRAQMPEKAVAIGITLVRMGREDCAIPILAAAGADGWDAFASMGDTLLVDGDLEQAFAMYRQSGPQGHDGMLRAREKMLERGWYYTAWKHSVEAGLAFTPEELMQWIAGQMQGKWNRKAALEMLVDSGRMDEACTFAHKLLAGSDLDDGETWGVIDALGHAGMNAKAAEVARSLFRKRAEPPKDRGPEYTARKREEFAHDLAHGYDLDSFIGIARSANDTDFLQEIGAFCAQMGKLREAQKAYSAGIEVCMGLREKDAGSITGAGSVLNLGVIK